MSKKATKKAERVACPYCDACGKSGPYVAAKKWVEQAEATKSVTGRGFGHPWQVCGPCFMAMSEILASTYDGMRLHNGVKTSRSTQRSW